MAEKKNLITCFKGGDLILQDGRLVRGDLWVRKGRILDPLHLFYKEKKKADIVIDCSGFLISPGFIDIQINGINYNTVQCTNINIRYIILIVFIVLRCIWS